MKCKYITSSDDSKSLSSTDTGPTSLSPNQLRGSRLIPWHHKSVGSSVPSIASEDSEPISLDPKERPSKFAANLIKAYRNHLSSKLTEPGDGCKERSSERSSLTTMKYTDSRFGLYGYYFGHVCADNKLPAGTGVLCCYDGTIVEGNWGPHGSPPIEKCLRSRAGSKSNQRIPSYIYIPTPRKTVRWADMMCSDYIILKNQYVLREHWATEA
jgi:hypothetical protein